MKYVIIAILAGFALFDILLICGWLRMEKLRGDDDEIDR